MTLDVRFSGTWVAIDPMMPAHAQNGSASVPDGSPIVSTPGLHVFTVRGVNLGSEKVSASVSYPER